MSQTVSATESSDGGSAPLTVAAVAGELGVAAATLRTWDRRYGLGPSEHEAGSHRRYTPSDVARLQLMRRLTLRGVAPGDAARIATSGTSGEPGEHGGLLAPEPPSEEVAELPLLIDPLSLAAAAVEADIERLARIMRKAVRTHGLIGAWCEVAAPARELLASEHHHYLQRPGVDPMAVLDVAVLLAARTAAGEREASAHAPVLLQAEPDARLEAHVLAGALGEREVPVLVLAPDAPGELDPLDGEGGAHLRVLVVVGAPRGAEDLVTRASRRGDVEVYLVGPRCPKVWLPHVHRVRTLEAAVAEITVSAGAATVGSAAEIRVEAT